MQFHVTSDPDVLGPEIEAENPTEAAEKAVQDAICKPGAVTVRWNVQHGPTDGTWTFARVSEVQVQGSTKPKKPKKPVEKPKKPVEKPKKPVEKPKKPASPEAKPTSKAADAKAKDS